MKKIIVLSVLSLLLSCQESVQKQQIHEPTKENWKTEVEQTLKLFGHRNWIVIADSAYPEQSNPAIKTVTIDDSQIEAVDFVSHLIEKANHVDANIFIDKEMAYVQEKDAEGITTYISNLDEILKGKPIQTLLHEDIIRELDTSAKLFNVLIIKTDLAIPYTSVFFQLECGYWNGDVENDLRKRMESANTNIP